MGCASDLKLSYNLDQKGTFIQTKKAEIAQMLGQVSAIPGETIKEYAPTLVFFDEGLIILIQVVSARMALSRKFMADLGLSLHEKMQGGGKIHRQLVLWTEIQQKMVMSMQAGADTAKVKISDLIAQKTITADDIKDWVDRLGAAGITISTADLEALTFADVSDKKDTVEQETSSAQSLTDTKRAQLQAAETDYSTLATLYSSLQSSLKNILMGILRAQ